MKAATSLILIFFSFSSYSCELLEKTYSLSGPVTLLLEELDLLNSSKLLGISKFHPVKQKYNGKTLGGGLFLSKKTSDQFKDKILVYDKSRELAKILQKVSTKKTYQLDTRGESASEAFAKTSELVKKITVGCEKKLYLLKGKVQQVLRQVKLTGKKKRVLFYLGRINSKYPETIIANDGFVKELRLRRSFETYPTDLAYVYWSQKIHNDLKGFLHIGIVEGDSDQIQVQKVRKDTYNLSMRGVLTPGLSQVYFLQKFTQLQLN